jgi:hypothetical protein
MKMVQTQETLTSFASFMLIIDMTQKKCHALTKEIEKLISKKYLQEFVKRGIKYEQTKNNFNDVLPQIR